MLVSAQQLKKTVAAYLAAYPESMSLVAPITEALERGAPVTSRKEFSGHVTASAVLFGPDETVLLVHHRTLDRWLCPGGHLEPGDSDLTTAALRELAEETGVRAEDVEPAGSVPVHIDVHPIPANDAKGEPEHRHFDVRMLFRIRRPVELTAQQEEVLGAVWRPFEEIAHPILRCRVMEAVNRLDGLGARRPASPLGRGRSWPQRGLAAEEWQ
jgi:8-oxo-dGTP pyrophosphatase MutT (NUDIX family)